MHGWTAATVPVHTLSCPLACALQVAGVQPPKKVIITYKPDADSKTVQASCSCPSCESCCPVVDSLSREA